MRSDWIRRFVLAPLLGTGLVLGSAGSALAADAPPGLTRQQIRAQLRPIYQQLKQDSQFQALRAGLVGNFDNRQIVDAYLTYLPISPLEMLQLDMHERRYEIMVPRFIAEWHDRWIELHQEFARQLYGDVLVDSAIVGVRVDTSGAMTPSPELAAPSGLQQSAAPSTNRNVAATASPGPESYQGEIQIAVNPNSVNEMVAAANTWDDMSGSCGDLGTQAIFYSSDGGDTWGYTCAPDATAYTGLNCSGGLVFGSDPALAWDDAGNVFLNHMMICYSTSTKYAMVVARSTDGGANWSGRGVIKNSWGTSDLEDKNFYAIDNDSSSAYYGRHYTCWDRNNDEKVAYSTDGGASWTEVDLPTTTGSGTGSRFDLACELEVEDDGTVHVVWNTLSCLSTCNNEEMFYSRSLDGGATWSTPVEVRDFSLVGFSGANFPDAQDDRGIGPFGALGVDSSGGTCDGNLYATFGDFGGGEDVNDTDVWVSRSTDGGATWQTPVKVNDDGLANRVQFHPFLQVDQSDGSVIVAWHDARNDSGNDAVDYYLARSTDCGATFEANIQLSQASGEFNNSTISYSNENTTDNPNANPNQYGEYLGVDALNGKAYVAWTDTRHYYPGSSTESQDENLGFAVVDFSGNTTPTVSITAPSDGTTVTLGDLVGFTGTATDTEDGTLTPDLDWTSSIDGSIGTGGSFSTSALALGTHTITAVVTDSGGLAGEDSIQVTVNPPVVVCTDCIDWSSTPTYSYSTQDKSKNVQVQDGGDTIRLYGNTWRRTGRSFNVTPNTVLEFDFRSTRQGELHGIGFDADNKWKNNKRLFKIYGTQNWKKDIHWPEPYSTPGAWQHYVIPVGQYYTGSSMRLVLMNDKDNGTKNNISYFRNIRVWEDVPNCPVNVDFDSGAAGWFNSGASTCATGAFVLGAPVKRGRDGVTTQVGGDHTPGAGKAYYTAANPNKVGVDDVDRGVCIAESPVYAVAEDAELSIWYFHGQWRTGNDPAGDYFLLELSTDGGSSWSPMVSRGDSLLSASWKKASAAVSGGSQVKLRVHVSDGPASGDLIEGGVDDLSICILD